MPASASMKRETATETNRIYDEKRLYAKIFGERIKNLYYEEIYSSA